MGIVTIERLPTSRAPLSCCAHMCGGTPPIAHRCLDVFLFWGSPRIKTPLRGGDLDPSSIHCPLSTVHCPLFTNSQLSTPTHKQVH
jgi:hypothetical protein